MARRRSPVPYLVIALLVAGIIGWATSPAPAFAQCGEPPKSSCTTCHEKEDPVATKGEWHQIHAAKDVCTSCHGGNATAADKAGAHLTLVAQPLSDIYTDCHSCHPDDYVTRADRFGAQLSVTPGSCATPTAAPTSAAAAALVVDSSPAAPHAQAADPWPMALTAAGIIALFVIGLLALARHQAVAS